MELRTEEELKRHLFFIERLKVLIEGMEAILLDYQTLHLDFVRRSCKASYDCTFTEGHELESYPKAFEGTYLLLQEEREAIKKIHKKFTSGLPLLGGNQWN